MPDDGLETYVPRLLLRRRPDGPTHWEAEGTLVFADVSGFTRLTEKLSRNGKAGAEEIVRTISDVFTVLLTATADGGDVLKFSGDALLLFYDTPDHAHRACHAALTMQRVLRAIGGIDSSRGRVRLRMSAGAHTGLFSFFLCGDEHLELFVLGRGASCAVAAEADAHAGEVVVTGATANAVEGATFRGLRGDGHVLRSVPALPPITPPPTGSVDGLGRHIAPSLRTRLGDLEQEHRRATVSFAHFGGIDQLLAREGADAAFGRVQALTTAAMRALDEYGVLLTATDVAVGGGTLMLTAGAPDATGDDEARMLRVVRRIVDADHGLPVRVGVNAGDLFAGTVGTPFRRTYSTMGAATNLAARLMGAAPWGGVLASRAVIDEVDRRFGTRPVPPLTVKGYDVPVHASLVEAAVSASTAAADRSVPFAGRTAELAVLESAVSDASAGRGSVIEVTGEAGVGKSRLVAELRARHDDIDWVQTACDPYERTSPFRTASVLLRRILQIPPDVSATDAGATLARAVAAVAPGLTPWLPLLATALRAEVAQTPQVAEIAPRYRRERIHEVVADLLAAVATEPAVVVIEDAEHCDDASAELIAALLARMLPAHPWLVVITRGGGRTGLHHGRGFQVTPVHLAPLDAATAAELAARLAEHTPVPVHRLPHLVEQAAGNPLFLAALVSAQADHADELPRSVEAIVAARIDGLDPDDRRALRYLSVLGDRFDADLLDAALASHGLMRHQHERWQRLAEFVTTDGEAFAFRNALVREVAYEGLPFRRRRELHARVADALGDADTGAAAQLPVHLLRAERWADAWTAAGRAAEQAREGGATAVAGELYDMALRAARRLEVADADVARAALAAGEVWERAGVWERALRAYDVAAATTHDRDGQLVVTLRRARTHAGAGRYPQALRLFRRVITAASSCAGTATGARLLARAHAGYASARLGQGRAADAVDHARQAVGLADLAADDATLADAHHLLDRAHAALGDHVTAARHRDAALPVFAALGDLAAQGTVLHDLGRDAHRAGRLEEALWLYGRSHDARARAGDVLQVAASANAIGEVLLVLGHHDDAHARFTEALRAWRGARAPVGVAEATGNLGVAALRRGRPTEAVRLLEEAADLAGRVGADALGDRILLPLAEALLASSRYVEAWDAASRVLASSGTDVAGTAHRLRGEALLRTGGTARARAELAAALEALTDADEIARVDGLLAEAG